MMTKIRKMMRMRVTLKIAVLSIAIWKSLTGYSVMFAVAGCTCFVWVSILHQSILNVPSA